LDSDDESLGVVEDDEFIAAVDGLKVVRDPLIDTFAPGAEKAVWRRISGSVCRFHRHHCSSLISSTGIPLLLRVMYIKQKLSFLEILSRP